jgi:hypothetical protein
MNNSKHGKCQCCGDFKELLSYNGSYSCGHCLSFDSKGVGRAEILNRIKNNEQYYRLRRDRKRNRKVSN